jgi:hypothetical protein
MFTGTIPVFEIVIAQKIKDQHTILMDSQNCARIKCSESFSLNKDT